ncbi:hypothetical protein GALMADRAFT_214829 [Galerina marginata CBS 339.88]|uniref:RING-type domain-containing protein n=1 Tax=Galerina marginata (strain CBS 339.88) TaxID=685588 RepID=A0A067SGQ8_GALM3|nr:hypothetical protein GALMADRAFT_214829 [Galerina marginata CBS 339.88]
MESKARPLAPLREKEPEAVSLPKDNPTPRSKLSHARSGDFVWQLALLQGKETGIATGKQLETTTTQPSRGKQSQVEIPAFKSLLKGENTLRSAGLRRSRRDLDLKSKVDFQEATSQPSAGLDKKLAKPGVLGKQDQLSPLPDKTPVKSSAHQGRDQEYVWQLALHRAELAWATQPSLIPEHRHDRKGKAMREEISAALAHHLSGNQAWLVSLEHRFQDGSYGSGPPIPEHHQDRKAQAVKEEISAALACHLSGNQAWFVSLEHRFQDGSDGAGSLKRDLQNGVWEYPKFERFQASLFHEQSQLQKSDRDRPSSPIVTEVDHRPENKLLRRRASEDVVMLPSSSNRRRPLETLTKIEERPASIAFRQFEHLQPSSVHARAQLHKAHGDKPSFPVVTGADHRPEKKSLRRRVPEDDMLRSSSNRRCPPEILTKFEETFFARVEPQSEQFECGVCGENRDVTEKLTLADCVHFFCKECLTTYAKTKIDEAQYPIPCPGCLAEKRNDNIRPSGLFISKVGCRLTSSKPVTQDILDKLNLGSRRLQKLEGLQLAAYSVTIKCPRCGRQWCKTCLKTFAGPYSAQVHHCEAPLEFDELMQKEGWKYCPGCRTPVQRSSGCHHMTEYCSVSLRAAKFTFAMIAEGFSLVEAISHSRSPATAALPDLRRRRRKLFVIATTAVGFSWMDTAAFSEEE